MNPHQMNHSLVQTQNLLTLNNQSLPIFPNIGTNNSYDRAEVMYSTHTPTDSSNSNMWMDHNFCSSIVSKNSTVNSFQNSGIDLLGFLGSGMELNGNGDNFPDFPIIPVSKIDQNSNTPLISNKSRLTPLSLNKNSYSLPLTDEQSLPSLVQNLNRPVINNEMLLDRNIANCSNNINLPENTHNSLSNLNNLSHISADSLMHETANDLQFPDSLINSTTDLSGLDCLNVLANSGCDRDVPDTGQWENINLITPSAMPAVPQLNSDFPDTIFAQAVEELPCYKCKFCSSIYITFSRDEMVSHLKTLHEKEMFLIIKQVPVVSQSTPLPPWNTVSTCNSSFPTSESNQNIESDSIGTSNINSGNEPSVTIFLCNKCPKTFFTLDDLNKHTEAFHSAGKTNQNARTSKNKPTNGHLPLLAPKIGNRQPTPSISMKKKRPMTPLKKISRDRQKAQQGCYICEFKGCNVRFRLIENLEYHCKCHADGKNANNNSNGNSFACPECNFQCVTWNSMSGHVWRRHFIDLELHACDQCSFRTYSLSKLENLHKRTHSNKRNYVCPKCKIGFKTYKLLWSHKNICMDLLKNAPVRQTILHCKVCKNMFNSKKSLRVHMETVHFKVRPYQCQICGYSANRPATLKLHIRAKHNGDKPFACELCTFRTNDRNSLRRHNMGHSGEKPYKCRFCSYSCIQSSTFKAHLKKKHPGENNGLVFTCKLCNFHTVNQQLLLSHSSTHKPEDSNSLNSGGITASNSPSESQSSNTNQSQDSMADNQIISLVQAVQCSIHDREIT